ncbi:hypothetical protein Btru_010864 [Bulinus truncatus]|nr:hypothetical protein Btru_010864 [Bulinus truncatus]
MKSGTSTLQWSGLFIHDTTNKRHIHQRIINSTVLNQGNRKTQGHFVKMSNRQMVWILVCSYLLASALKAANGEDRYIPKAKFCCPSRDCASPDARTFHLWCCQLNYRIPNDCKDEEKKCFEESNRSIKRCCVVMEWVNIYHNGNIL